MESHFNHYVISLTTCLVGCVVYVVFAATRHGLENVQESMLIRVFGDLLMICAASRVVVLSFDEALCSSVAKIDMAFMTVGAILIMIVTMKDLISKFK